MPAGAGAVRLLAASSPPDGDCHGMSIEIQFPVRSRKRSKSCASWSSARAQASRKSCTRTSLHSALPISSSSRKRRTSRRWRSRSTSLPTAGISRRGRKRCRDCSPIHPSARFTWSSTDPAACFFSNELNAGGSSMGNNVYKAKKFNLSGLQGISDKTLEMHFGLYEGYVKNTNLLTEQLLEMSRSKKASPTNPSFTEIKRHLGFESGGMVLHEYYFGNLAPKGKGNPSSELKRALEESFGGFDAWKADFVATGGMRGVEAAEAFL